MNRKFLFTAAVILLASTITGVAVTPVHTIHNGKAEAAYWPTVGFAGSDELHLMHRLVAAEASGEPYEGQVAVAAVIVNRVRSPSFPNTIAGVIYQPGAFESVMSGYIWRVRPSSTALYAARDALNGWDPTYGALYFWNPSKRVSPWIWTRRIIRWIGRHVFAR